MKSKTLVSVIGLLSAVVCSAANPRLIPVESRSLFAPVGFDDNDEVQIVLDGYLPDTCYRLASPQVEVNMMARQIVVQQMAYLFSTVCFDMTVPYTTVVSLGRIHDGEYAVVTRDGRLIRSLRVKDGGAQIGPDEFLYAPIDSARVEYRKGSSGGLTRMAVLEGRVTSSCMRLKDIKVFDHLATGTVEMLPIMAIDSLRAREECHTAERPFKVEAPIPPITVEGRYLLHVRSLNGASLNVVFDSRE
ncbi:MAG: hypothetical protein HYR96_02705 [Deltaproteobacteria bacterium]|nr:hypothetical protein [Deltaproteobacteria bacterium]MBI3294854.1 hypothetical protein [Deltaproteobacteria bacterium]